MIEFLIAAWSAFIQILPILVIAWFGAGHAFWIFMMHADRSLYEKWPRTEWKKMGYTPTMWLTILPFCWAFGPLCWSLVLVP